MPALAAGMTGMEKSPAQNENGCIDMDHDRQLEGRHPVRFQRLDNPARFTKHLNAFCKPNNSARGVTSSAMS